MRCGRGRWGRKEPLHIISLTGGAQEEEEEENQQTQIMAFLPSLSQWTGTGGARVGEGDWRGESGWGVGYWWSASGWGILGSERVEWQTGNTGWWSVVMLWKELNERFQVCVCGMRCGYVLNGNGVMSEGESYRGRVVGSTISRVEMLVYRVYKTQTKMTL